MNQPVAIVGGGLTGMAISHTLSEAAIPHVLIGGPPSPLPTLGESLNLEGTLLIDQFCGQFAEHFFGPKDGAVAFMGDHMLYCDFNVAMKRSSRAFFRLLGVVAPPEFLHIDRIGLDAALWEHTLRSPHCTVADAKVESVGYDQDSDVVTEIALSDGSVLQPRYVFDASNHKRLVANAIDVPWRTIGAPQRVVFTHYHPPEGTPRTDPPAHHLSTNLLRLFESTDGMEGMAWYIPLPTYISIGVSMNDGSNDHSDEEILELTAAAYRRRGLDYRRSFPRSAKTMNLHHRYFVHDRAYGANWLLAGGTYASVWWLAGAGVGTSFVAGRMAADIVRDPLGKGFAYGNYLKDLVPIHDTFDWFVYAPLTEVEPEKLDRQSDRFVRTNVSRLATAAQMSERVVPRMAGKLLAWLVRAEVTPRHYCEVISEPMTSQATRMWGPSVTSSAPMNDEEVVRRLGDVISGALDIGWSHHLLAPDVVCHLDAFTATGARAWQRWLRFLRSRPGMDGLELDELESRVLDDGRIELEGRWRAGTRISSRASATYRVVDGRIAEIWTCSANYEFILGRRTGTRVGMISVFAQSLARDLVQGPRASHR